MKVVVAVDDTPASGDLVDTISRRHWPDDTQFKLISVIEPFDLAEEHGDKDWNELLRDVSRRRVEHAERNCSSIRHKLEKAVPKSIVHFEIRHGDARHEIIDCAAEWGADRILIGAKGKQICPFNLLGSVSRAVASNAGCSVEIVRPSPQSHKHALAQSAESRQRS